MPRARTDGRMLVRSGFLVTPRMLADETESWAISICLSSMIVSPLLFKTTAAPAERGGRRERPERPAMKAGRTRRVGTKWRTRQRSEEHTSELQSLMRISYAVFCLKKKKKHTKPTDAT